MEPAETQRVDVTRTYLELRRRSDLRASRSPAAPPRLVRLRPISANDYLALYALVGERWHWRDRFAWPAGALDAHLQSPLVHVWVARIAGDVVGYFELVQRPDATVEIMYFGLAPAWIGQGLGGWLLTRAVEEAFTLGAERVTLNTCTLDGPHAMANYLARGFTVVCDEVYEVEL